MCVCVRVYKGICAALHKQTEKAEVGGSELAVRDCRKSIQEAKQKRNLRPRGLRTLRGRF